MTFFYYILLIWIIVLGAKILKSMAKTRKVQEQLIVGLKGFRSDAKEFNSVKRHIRALLKELEEHEQKFEKIHEKVEIVDDVVEDPEIVKGMGLHDDRT